MSTRRASTRVSEWCPVEVYATFIKLVAEIELTGSERLSDGVNRAGAFIHLRNARTEPLSVNYPVISRKEPATTVAKSAVILISPAEDEPEGTSAMWREKVSQAAAINTMAFSLVCDVHLDKRTTLEDHLERSLGDFLPVTNVSALWIAAGKETHAVQRPFALLNPGAILSFSPR
jgi:hypothetical protein